jgi:hypothetical protein
MIDFKGSDFKRKLFCEVLIGMRRKRDANQDFLVLSKYLRQYNIISSVKLFDQAFQ